MLIDRACKGGGWNAGNAVAFGVALAPHVEATAIALLALQNRREEGAVSLDCLETHMRNCSGVTSAAWTVLALDAYCSGSAVWKQRLDHLHKLIQRPDEIDDTSTLAISTLAVRTATGKNPFRMAT